MQIEALRDLKVKQEELSKNERMTRKKMVSNIRALQVLSCYNWSPGPFMAATAGPPGPFAALQMVPPDQLWCRDWSPFATACPPYNPAFIAFLLKHIATLKMELKIAALHACQCT